VFGGSLTALSYPVFALTAVEAFRKYAEPVRPFIGYPRHEEHSTSS